LQDDHDLVEIQKIHLKKNEIECLNITKNEVLESNETLSCPPIFDQILCWERTPANKKARKRCPVYFVGFSDKEYATRVCTENGTWELRGNNTYTNYARCVETDDPEEQLLIVIRKKRKVSSLINFYKTFIYVFKKHLPYLKLINKIGCSISLCSLTIALILMFFLK
jgi:hypothetical protein